MTTSPASMGGPLSDADRLAEIRARLVESGEINNEHNNIAWLLSRVGMLEGQLATAREVHYPVNIFAESDEPPYVCGWRAVCNHSENAWPCDTARALGLDAEAIQAERDALSVIRVLP